MVGGVEGGRRWEGEEEGGGGGEWEEVEEELLPVGGDQPHWPVP